MLADLEHCSAVSRKLIRRAIRLRITSEVAFQCFVASRFPLGIDADPDEILDRAGAVAVFGDAKAIQRGSEEGIMIRSVHSDVELVSADSQKRIAVGKLSLDAGGAAFQLTSDTRWTFSGSMVIVENAEPFWRYEQVLPEIELAVYAAGNMSNRLLDWLASGDLAGCSLVHWGDYDPCGVLEYLRLAKHCPSRVTSFVPNNIDRLMQCGNRSLLIKQANVLERLRAACSEAHVSRMVDLFDKHRRCLEQEALLIPDN